jgi:hypothetical protein
MNSTLSYDVSENDYHNFKNVEFTGVFVRSELCPWNNITNSIDRTKQSYKYDYNLFIKYGDKVYVDFFNVGEIVISYNELQEKLYLKHYYDLSVMIAGINKTVIKKTKYKNDEPIIYNEDRFWGIECAFLDGTYKNDETLDKVYKLLNRDLNKDLYYYNINPYDLENMEYSSQEEILDFQKKFMEKKNDDFYGSLLKETYDLYKNIIIDYNKSIAIK